MGKTESFALLIAVVSALVVALAAAAPPSPRRRWVWVGGVSGLVLALLYLSRSVLPVFIMGLFLAYLLDPIIDFLQSRGWRRIIAIALVFCVFFAILATAALLLVPLIVSELQNFLGNIASYQEAAQKLALSLVERAKHIGGDYPDSALPQYTQEALDKLGRSLSEWVANAVKGILSWLLGSIRLLLSFLLVPLTTFYFLRDFAAVKAKLKASVPASQLQKTVVTVRALESMVGRFLRGMVSVCLAIGVVGTLVLSGLALIFHFQYVLLIGLFMGLTYAIPFVGAWSSVILGTSIAYFTGTPPFYSALAVAIALITLNQVFDTLVTPAIVGKSMGLHPLWVLFALMVAGKLFGLPGMILAWPVAGVIQIILVQYLSLAKEQKNPEVALDDQPTS